MSKHQQTIAEEAVKAVTQTRSEVADELAFIKAVFAKLPDGPVKDQYAGMAAGSAARLANLDVELEALAKVRAELVDAGAANGAPAPAPAADIIRGVVVAANGGAP